MSIAYRYTRDINISQDFLQESFIIIFKKLDQFEPTKGNFEGWTARILINKILEHKRKTRELYFEDYIDLEPITENTIFHKLSVDELKVEIAKLPEIYRIILQLHYFDEFSHAEIAEMLNIEQSSSRSRLTRAKQLITAGWRNLQTVNNHGVK
jgi:RNA polymerase sigma-70 factor (ECF subfamily)